MEHLTNVTISKAYKGKSGVSSFGPWQAWSVYIVDCETKFDYFEKGGIVPYDGMKVNVLEYEIKQNGEYTNYDIKKLVPDVTAQPLLPGTNAAPRHTPATHVLPVRQTIPVGSGAEESKRLLMCTSYVKDLMVELIKKGTSMYDISSLEMIIEKVADGSLQLVKQLTALPSEKTGAKAETPLPVSPTIPAKPAGTAAPAKPVVSTPAPVLPDDVPF